MRTLLCVAFAAIVSLSAVPANANALNSWRISCSVDRGAISHTRDVWSFRTSANNCPGGVFHQRAEISTDSVSPSTKGAYLFSAHVAMNSRSNEKYDIFQIHDGRLGCSPPLKVNVLPNGQLKLVSDIKTGPGESCIRGQLSNQTTQGRIRRDGTEQKLEVLVEFDGNGGFKATIWLDGAMQVSGRYDPAKQPGAYRSKKFFFKHGVYSQHMFDYVMTSRGMSVRKVKVRN